MLHKFNSRFFKDDYTLSKECCMHTVYDMFKQYLIVLGFTVKMHILQFSRGELPTPKDVILKIWLLSWKKTHYAFRKMMCHCQGHILHAYIYHVFFI